MAKPMISLLVKGCKARQALSEAPSPQGSPSFLPGLRNRLTLDSGSSGPAESRDLPLKAAESEARPGALPSKGRVEAAPRRQKRQATLMGATTAGKQAENI